LRSADTSFSALGHESVGAAGERAEAFRQAVAVQQRLAQPALEGRGLDAVAGAIAAAVGGEVLVLGPAGRTLARHDPGGALTDAVAADLGRDLAARGDTHHRILTHPALPAGAYARPVPPARGAGAEAWIVVTPAEGRVDEPVRLVLQQAAAIVGLELLHRGDAGETQRRLTAGLVGDAFAGRTEPAELGRRLAAFGIEGDVAVVVFGGLGARTLAWPAAERALRAALAAADVAAAVAIHEVDGRDLLCAIVEVGEGDPIAVAAAARRRLSEELGVPPVAPARPAGGAEAVRAAVSRARPAAELARTFQEAYWALGAIEHEGAGRATDAAVGSWHDLGVESLLLAVGDQDVLQLYCDRLLGPVLAGDAVYAAELLRSLEVFILHNGQWERAAGELHCHRHTLRYRIRKIEELTGRDLAKATDRIEFWLALRARELAARSGTRHPPA
jgi:purine catabolism regulator